MLLIPALLHTIRDKPEETATIMKFRHLISTVMLFAMTPLGFAAQIFSDNFDTGSLNTAWDSSAGTTVVAGGANSTTHAASLAATIGALGDSLVTPASPTGMANFIIDGSGLLVGLAVTSYPSARRTHWSTFRPGSGNLIS